MRPISLPTHETFTDSFAHFGRPTLSPAESGGGLLRVEARCIIISYFGAPAAMETALRLWHHVCVICGWELQTKRETMPLFNTLLESTRLLITVPVAFTSLSTNPTKARMVVSLGGALGDCFGVVCSHSDQSNLALSLTSNLGVCGEYCGLLAENGRAYLGGHSARLGVVGHWHALTVLFPHFSQSKFPPGLFATSQEFAMSLRNTSSSNRGSI